MTCDHEALTAVEREALRSRVERNWPFEVDDTTADEIRDIADGVAVEVERIIAARLTCDHEAQIRDLLEEREELLTEIRRLRMGNHPAGRALRAVDEAAWRDLQAALTERDAEHEGGGGA